MSQSQSQNEPVTQQTPQTIFLRTPKPEDLELTPEEKQAGP